MKRVVILGRGAAGKSTLARQLCDLGPHDVVEVRLRAADTVILLDFGLVLCAWRALRRARERTDFWRWVLAYRRESVPYLRALIARHAPDATVHVLRSPSAVNHFLRTVAGQFGAA